METKLNKEQKDLLIDCKAFIAVVASVLLQGNPLYDQAGDIIKRINKQIRSE